MRRSSNLKIQRYVMRQYQSNSYLVADDFGTGIIIDAGGEGESIVAAAREAGLEVALLVLTHGHFDHVGAVREVKEGTGCTVAIHRDDAGKLGRFSLNTIITRSVAPQPERLLSAGDEIAAGELRFTVLHTPGHTPGGICIYGHGVVFTGDTLFRRSVGRTDMPRGSHSELLRSIQSNLLVLPDETVVLPGHGASSTIGEERRENPFLSSL